MTNGKKTRKKSLPKTKKQPIPVIDPLILLSEKEKKQLIKAEKRKAGLTNFILKIFGFIVGVFFIISIGITTYDYIQTKNHQSPLLCFNKIERKCESINNDGLITTCHGFGYKSIIPSKECNNIAADQYFFGFLWDKDPYENIK